MNSPKQGKQTVNHAGNSQVMPVATSPPRGQIVKDVTSATSAGVGKSGGLSK